jgi:hypothetical protein
MKTEFRPRVPQVRCWKCGKLQISALCHHCWRPGCADHVVSVPPWARSLLGREGAGRGPENDEAYHCKKCSHAATRPQLVLGVLGTVAVVAGLILLLPSPTAGLAVVLAGALLAGLAYLAARRRAARGRAAVPLLLHPKINDLRLTETLGVDISLAPAGSYETNLRPVEGKISLNLVFGRPDRDRLDRYLGKRASDRDTRFSAGCLLLQGPVDIEPQPDLPDRVYPLTGTTGAYPVFQAEDPHASSSWRMERSYRLNREPTIRQGPVWVTPSLVPESDRRALELDIQWVDLGPRDKRLGLDVMELIRLRYPVTWGNVELASKRAIQSVTAGDGRGADAVRSVEWRQLVPSDAEREARRLTLMVRFEAQIDSEDLVSGRLEAVMKGGLSGVDGARLYSSLGQLRDDWRGATIRTRIEADFRLSLVSIRYQDVRIVPKREATDDDSNAEEFRVIPDDQMVIRLTNALSENYYVKRVIEHPPRSGGRADHMQRYWDIAGRRYEGVYPIEFHMVLTGEEIHRGGIRAVAGTTKVQIVVHGAYTDDQMKNRVDQEWKGLRALTRETLEGLERQGHAGTWGDAPGDTDPPQPESRLLKRLGQLDEALLEGRISPEQYEEMKARAGQEFGDS